MNHHDNMTKLYDVDRTYVLQSLYEPRHEKTGFLHMR